MALLVTSQHFPLAMNRIIEVTFGVAQRMDVMVTFPEAADESILKDIGRLPGVLSVEPLRSSDVIFEAGSTPAAQFTDRRAGRRRPEPRARREHAGGAAPG